jgi:hypothetical protein
MASLIERLEKEYEYHRALLMKKDPTNEERLLIKLLIIAHKNTRWIEKYMN